MIKSRKPFKLRVLHATRNKEYQTHWLLHYGTDVYCGTPGNTLKLSYHESGARHTDYQRFGMQKERQIHQPHSKLVEVKNYYPLTTYAYGNSEDPFAEYRRVASIYTGKKADAIIRLDGTSIPFEGIINIQFGFLEPGRTDLLDQITTGPGTEPPITRSITLIKEFCPWLCVMTMW